MLPHPLLFKGSGRAEEGKGGKGRRGEGGEKKRGVGEWGREAMGENGREGGVSSCPSSPFFPIPSFSSPSAPFWENAVSSHSRVQGGVL